MQQGILRRMLLQPKLADECLIQVSYAIGVKEPISVYVNTNGTGKIPDSKLSEIIRKEIDLTPQGIIKRLDLKKPIYRKTAAYGHFGRNEKGFTWEETNLVATLVKAVK